MDNIKIDLGETGWRDINWIYQVQDRNHCRALVKPVLNLLVP
jgi:hypothetical protein